MNTSADMDPACLLLYLAWPEQDHARLSIQTQDGLAPTTYPATDIAQDTPLEKLPWLLVRSALWQLLVNLSHLRESDDSELVHQARIGWRRLRSTMREFRNLDSMPAAPVISGLSTLMARLRQARDVDVARLEVLPGLNRMTHGHVQPWSGELSRLISTLDHEAHGHMQVIRTLLGTPTVVRAMWELVVWLEQLQHFGSQQPVDTQGAVRSARHWIHHRLERLHMKFKTAKAQASDSESLHRARILAKRLRYVSEDFTRLSPQTYRKWYQQAMQYQSSIGQQRDTEMAAALARKHGACQVAALLLETVGQPHQQVSPEK